jgi:hypothetical protein
MIEHPNHGSVIWKYLALEKTLWPPNFIDYAMTYATILIQPIGHVLFWVCYLGFPTLYTYFGGTHDMSFTTLAWYIVSSIQVLVGAIQRWSEVVEHYNLGTTILVWKILTHAFGVPLLDIRSKDLGHQYFKYAAGASLLQDIC